MAMDELKYKDGKFTVNGIDVSEISATTEAVEIAQTVSANTSQFSVIDSPEYIELKLDSEDKIIEGTKIDGTKYINQNVILLDLNSNNIESETIKSNSLKAV